MSHIRSKNTKPEIRLRKKLFNLGYRYRINKKDLPGKPDIVLPKYHTCIFVNGCFWHGHKGCPKYVVPKTNTELWLSKIDANKERDLRDYTSLECKGWRVLVVWECELNTAWLPDTVDRVSRELEENRRSWMEDDEKRRIQREDWQQEMRRRKECRDQLLKELK